MDCAIGRDQNHPLGTERGQDGAEAAALDQCARGLDNPPSVATAMPVASASSRRFGFSKSRRGIGMGSPPFGSTTVRAPASRAL